MSPVAGLSILDLEYLMCKGAFTWPGSKLRNILYQSYMMAVHPNIPAVEPSQITEVFDSSEGPGKSVSWFLAQAMMAAATTAVQVEHVHDAGFESRHHMTEHFFEKAKVSSHLIGLCSTN